MVLCVHCKGILLMVIFLFVVGTETVGANLLIFVFSIFSSSLAFRDRKHRRVVLQLIATDVWQRRGVTKKDLRGVGYLRGWEWRALSGRLKRRRRRTVVINLKSEYQ
jgi:hypothetical protein